MHSAPGERSRERGQGREITEITRHALSRALEDEILGVANAFAAASGLRLPLPD